MAYKSKSYRKFLATGTTAALVASAIAPAASAADHPFTDVNTNYDEAVSYLFSNNITKGYTETTFGTYMSLTRGNAAVIIANALNLDTTSAADAGFEDVNSRVAGSVNALVEAGIMDGFSDTEFRPDVELSRGAMAKILVNAYDLQGQAMDTPFTDLTSTFGSYIEALYGAGITTGKTETTFGTNQEILRGEFAVLLYKSINFEPIETPEVSSVMSSSSTEFTVNFEEAVEEGVEVEDLMLDVTVVLDNGTEVTPEVTGAKLSADRKSVTIMHENNDLDGLKGMIMVNGVDGAFDYSSAKVTMAKAANASQLLVTFNKDVYSNGDNTGSAENEANYDVKNNAVTKAEVQEDGKTVKLTLGTAYSKATDAVLTVKGVALKADTDETFPVYASVVKVDDSVKAQITSVTSKTNGSTATTATVNFSEPVTGGIVKIDGSSVATITGSQESLAITGLSLDSSKSHKVEIVNLKDSGNNVNSLATAEFTVTKDAAAPSVASVTPHGDYKILVAFDKKIDATSVAATDVSVKDELLNGVTVSDFSALSGDKSGTKFVITLDKTKAEVANLYKNKDSRSLTVVFADKSVSDSLGNKLAATTKNVVLTKDVTNPSITGLSFEKDSTSKEVTEISVMFDEEVNSLDTSKFVIVNENGVLKTDILNSATVSYSGKIATIDITDASLTGKYSFQIASGAALDYSLTPNKSKAFSGTVDFGSTEQSGTFELASGAINDDTTNVIKVTFPEKVKGGAVAGSATDLNNYSLNGKPLPEGSTITLNAAQTLATITIGDEGIKTNDTNAVFTINNVTSLTGKTIKPVTTTVEITDNLDPVLESARVLDNNSIELTYSEDIKTLSTVNVGTEFTVYEGSTAISLADNELTASSVSGYKNKVVIDLVGETLDLAEEISVKTLVPSTGIDVLDSNNNSQKVNVKLTAAK